MDDVLLTKYLLKEASEVEARVVRSWIEAHPDNGRYYSRLQQIWDTSRLLADESEIDEQEAWTRFVQRRDAAGDAVEKPAKPLIRKMGWLRVAAILIMGSTVAFAGYYLMGSDRVAAPLYGTLHEATDAVSTDTLADGSVITLSKYASLRFSRGLFQQKRAAELRAGSVFFQVTPNQKKPFVVQSGDVRITVLGTAFHVMRNGDETTVIVTSGKVKVTGLGKAVELEARQRAIINTATQHFEEGAVVGVLDHTPLWRIAEMLEDVYEVEITIANNDIRNLPMTTTLHSGTLDETLHIITETLGISATRQGNQIVFN